MCSPIFILLFQHLLNFQESANLAGAGLNHRLIRYKDSLDALVQRHAVVNFLHILVNPLLNFFFAHAGKLFRIVDNLQGDHQIPIVSSMGAGAKTDPAQVRIADISKSINCTLARAVRKRLHALGIRKGIPVVFSTEFADMNAVIEVENESNKRTTAGTVAYMPAIFGCYLAAHVLKHMV